MKPTSGILYVVDDTVKCAEKEKPQWEDYEVDGCDNACEHYIIEWRKSCKDVVNWYYGSVGYTIGISLAYHLIEFPQKCLFIPDGEGVRVTKLG